MSYEFTDDEIKEIVKAARIFSQSFNEEEFQALRELEDRLSDSGFLETLRGLVRMQEEMGATANQILDAVEELLGEREQLEAEIADLQAKLATLRDRTQEAENRYRQQQATIRQAGEELQAIQFRCQKEEEKLTAFEKKAERRKGRIDKEIEEYQQKANVTKEEVDLASQVKAQVEKHGFSLELALDIAHEFAGYENAREELAQALKESQTLPNHVAALTSELRNLKSETNRRQLEIAGLKAARLLLENILSQLRGDLDTEQKLKKFYNRYQSASWLMEYLAGWRELYFLRCNNPLFALTGFFDRRTSCAHFWVEKEPIRRCPVATIPVRFLTRNSISYSTGLLALPISCNWGRRNKWQERRLQRKSQPSFL